MEMSYPSSAKAPKYLAKLYLAPMKTPFTASADLLLL